MTTPSALNVWIGDDDVLIRGTPRHGFRQDRDHDQGDSSVYQGVKRTETPGEECRYHRQERATGVSTGLCNCLLTLTREVEASYEKAFFRFFSHGGRNKPRKVVIKSDSRGGNSYGSGIQTVRETAAREPIELERTKNTKVTRQSEDITRLGSDRSHSGYSGADENRSMSSWTGMY
jgi:hypothetical protein